MNQSHRPLIVVDDDSIVFMMINRIVKKRRIDVEVNEVEHANVLLDKLRNPNNDTNPGIILLDINMPNMDGWTFIEQLINLHINCPHKIYIHSSSDSLMDVNRAKSYEGIVNGYIAKNISPETLLMLLEAYESNTFAANQFLYLKEGW
jgi:CheY-like chemotaxis protein